MDRRYNDNLKLWFSFYSIRNLDKVAINKYPHFILLKPEGKKALQLYGKHSQLDLVIINMYYVQPTHSVKCISISMKMIVLISNVAIESMENKTKSIKIVCNFTSFHADSVKFVSL